MHSAPSSIEMPEVRVRMMAFTLEVLGPVLRRALNFIQRTGPSRWKATRHRLHVPAFRNREQPVAMTVLGIAGSEGRAAMKVQIACFVLVSAVATMSGSAQAADWGGGRESYRDVSVPAGIPVPAPVPIPEYAPSWYFRFDAGLGVVNEPDVSDDEFIYGQDGPGPVTGPGLDRFTPTSWFNTDFDTFLTLGAGVGYYFGNGWRLDATIEKRSKDDVSISGDDEYITYGLDGSANWNPIDVGGAIGTPDTRTRLTIDERSKIDGTLWMANAYYDFRHAYGFTPYVGAGVGFVWNEISRSRNQTVETCDNEAVGDAGCAGPATEGTYTEDSTRTFSESDKADKVTLAAAAMAGFSYDVSEMTSVDIGYRYLYLQGTSAVLSIGDQTSRLEIGDQHVHQIRAGLRFDVD